MAGRLTLEAMIWQHDTRAGRIFDRAVFGLIIFSVALLSIETLPGLPAGMQAFLQYAEMPIALLFTAEYILRIKTAPDRGEYMRSPYGLIDLLAIAPFWGSLGWSLLYGGGSEVMESLMIMRVLRLFRIFRIFKLVRYNAAIQRFDRALAIAREELLIFLLVAGILTFIAAFLIHHSEYQTDTAQCFQSVFHSLWWALVTLTTIGYGDCIPVTPIGRILTSLIAVIGLGVVAAPAGIIASALTKARHAEQEENRRNE